MENDETNFRQDTSLVLVLGRILALNHDYGRNHSPLPLPFKYLGRGKCVALKEHTKHHKKTCCPEVSLFQAVLLEYRQSFFVFCETWVILKYELSS